jgi:eukaryotic-like serine/threonine-protein kinase
VKSFFRLVLLALILLVVALVSALTTMRFAIHGREGTVPDLVQKSFNEARRLADSAGFEVIAERQYYSATIPEGKILSQMPAAGTLVRRGWQIRVAQSLGPQRVEIPSVLGESERAAEMNIRRRGLDLGSVATLPSTGNASGLVLSQSPLPNASNVAAPKISLLLAEPAPPRAFVMPRLVGQPMSNARLLLQTAGLRIGYITQAAAQPAPGTPGVAAPVAPSPVLGSSIQGIVVSHVPGPGEKVLAGTAVNFVVR